MGRCRGRSKEQPKNTPISLHDRRLQHPKECSIPVALCPPAIVRLFLSGYLFLSPPLSQSFLSFSFSLSFPSFFSSSSFSSSSSSLSSSSCSSSHSIGTERDTKRDDVKSAGGTITKLFFVPPRSTLSSSIPLSPSFSLSLCWSNLARGSRSIVSEGRGREESRSWSGQVLMARLRVYDLASSTIRDDDREKGVDELFAILFRSCSPFESFEFRGVSIE